MQQTHNLSLNITHNDGVSDDLIKLQPRFLKFNKGPRSEQAKHYVALITKLILETEIEARLRKKKRRPADRLLFDQQVAAIASELACYILRDDYGRLFFNRSNQALGSHNRYKAPFITKKLTSVIDAMAEAGLIRQDVGWRARGAARGIASSIYPTEGLRDLIADHQLTRSDFKALRPRESIVLKSDKREDGGGRKIPYADTPQTIRYREEVEELNQWIAQADLSFDLSLAQGKPIDISETHLRRIFIGGDFRYHGRLYGGFWQSLSKEQRSHGLTINGERVVALDYSSMIVRLAYSHAGLNLPDGDLYAIPGYPSDAMTRAALKRVVSSLFYRVKPMRRLPTDLVDSFPIGTTALKVKQSIQSYHPGIAHLMDTDIGHELTFKESQLLIEVLARLRDRQVVALPVHDCIIVPRSDLTLAKHVMLSSCIDLLGVTGEVKVE